jgi:hypothetical protein
MTPVIVPDYGALLNEARAAYHSLMMGGQARVFVDQNGERIEYSPNNITRLASYITYLEMKAGVSTCNGPLGGVFG